MEKKKVTVCTLQNWEIVLERKTLKFIGNIYNHPTIKDGSLHETDAITEYSKTGNFARNETYFYNLEEEKREYTPRRKITISEDD